VCVEIPEELRSGDRRYAKLELLRHEEPFFRSVKINLNEMRATKYKNRPDGPLIKAEEIHYQ